MSNIVLTPTPNAELKTASRIYVKSSTTQNKEIRRATSGKQKMDPQAPYLSFF